MPVSVLCRFLLAVRRLDLIPFFTLIFSYILGIAVG